MNATEIKYATIPFGSVGTQIAIVVGETPTKFKTVRFNASRAIFNPHYREVYGPEGKAGGIVEHVRDGWAISPVKKERVTFISRDNAIFDACRKSGTTKTHVEARFEEVRAFFAGETVGPTLRVQVIADGSGTWAGNRLDFSDIDEAVRYAKDLMNRWTLVTDWRVIDLEGSVLRQRSEA
jgi:hypothetical protein